MRILTHDTLNEILDYALVDGEDIVYGWQDNLTGYSGRDMHGRTCFALATDDPAKVLLFFQGLGQLIQENLHEERELPEHCACLAELASNLHTDALGRGTVYYFPNWQLESEGDMK